MADYLIKFGIGGVQRFIGQARKVRDFAASSILIAEVSRSMAAHAALEGQLLLPAGNMSLNKLPWPHQFMARVTCADDEALRVWANAVESAGRDYWQQTLSDALHGKISLGMAGNDATRRQQIEDALELYWVAVSEEGEDYKATYRALADAHEDRRRTRTFPATTCLGQARPVTCSVCGMRESVLQPRPHEWPKTWTLVSGRESLCAVCAGKRFWSMSTLPYVPSTHRFGWDRFFRDEVFTSVRELHAQEDWSRVLEDWRVLDNAYPNLEIPDEKGVAITETMREAFQTLRQNEKAWKALEQSSPYYALVLFDGDRMGEWMYGEHFSEDTDFETAQQSIAAALMRFATRVDTSLGALSPKTEVIYTGGDDGLFLCALDAFFPALEAVRQAWEGEVTNALDAASFKSGPPTLSLHATVLHAMAPLQPAMAEAARLLEVSKERADRNCISLLCAVRAGAGQEYIGTWDEAGKLCAAVEAFSNWRCDGTRSAKALPTRILHTLLEAAPPFFTGKPRQLGFDPRVFGEELARLGDRSEAATEDLAWQNFVSWLEERASGTQGNENPIFGEERLLSALSVTAFLSRELQWKGCP
jgi:CRISPR-associated protein Cmr2